jgi:DNA-binding NtrC family response regulator
MTRKTRVLIVDDEEIVRRGFFRVLANDDHDVETACSGDEALREMETHPFDIVLLDLRMPGMDGMEVLKTIRNRWPDSEVIIVTGYPTIETAKEAIRVGANNYLTKPTDPEDVIRVTGEAMSHKYWALRREPQHDIGAAASVKTASAN